MLRKLLWTTSLIITLLLIALLSATLYNFDERYDPDSEQLVNFQAIESYFKELGEKNPHIAERAKFYVMSGIFLESLEFIDENTLHMSGYIWQKYEGGVPENIEEGFVFPEGIGIKQYKAYEQKGDTATLIGWHFEGKFNQSFDYSRYPLDHKIVWLRLWPKDFGKGIVLVPDLASYDSVKARDKFGLDDDIILSGYTLLETFFKYKLTSYDSTFGFERYANQTDSLDLYFNVALKRNVLSAFIVNVFPLIIVLFLAFCGLLIVTSKKEDISRFGFSLSGILKLCSILLFVILLAHTQLRDKFSNENIVYLEYIYFILYFAIIYVAGNAFLVMKERKHKKHLAWLYYKDNIIPKIMFLPLVFLFILIVTYMKF